MGSCDVTTSGLLTHLLAIIATPLARYPIVTCPFCDRTYFHTVCSWLLVPLNLPFNAYFDHDSFVYVYLDQCVPEFILRGVWKICMLLAIIYVHIGKRPTPLNYAHAQHNNTILVPTYLPTLLPLVPIGVLAFVQYHYEYVVLFRVIRLWFYWIFYWQESNQANQKLVV